MALTDTYSQIGDAIRQQYGTNDKYSLADMSKMIDGLDIHNYLDEGQQSIGYVGQWGMTALTGLTKEIWNSSFLGKAITISFNAKWSGYKPSNDKNNRFGIEYDTLVNNKASFYGAWLYPTTASGNQVVTASFNVPNQPIDSLNAGYMYDQINKDAILEITNPKIVINPMGGVIPVNLFNGHLKCEPQFVKQEGTLYTFDITTINPPYDSFIFTNGVVLVEPNQAYKLKFKARGTGSFWTYEYGNNYQGTYVDNGHEWNLTDQWQDYEQLFPIESVPIKHDDNGFKDGFLVDIRTMKPLQGEIADIEFTPIN